MLPARYGPGKMTDLVLIAGPTASGKTALALALARTRPILIVNADSMQVYRDLGIISAQPGDEDLRKAPHRLFGMLDAAQACSAARWRDLALEAIAEARREGRLPVMVGGTGLYFRALLEGLAEVPEIPAEVRAEVRQALIGRGAAALHHELQQVDPAMAARLNPADGQRIARALEVVRATGRSLADYQQHDTAGLVPAGRAILGAVINFPRDELRRRIEQRFRQMIASGAMAEIEALASRGLDPHLPAMKALGVPSLIAAHQGKMTLEEAIAEACIKSRRYAKRQETWFRHQFPDWLRLDGTDSPGALATLNRAIGGDEDEGLS